MSSRLKSEKLSEPIDFNDSMKESSVSSASALPQTAQLSSFDMSMPYHLIMVGMPSVLWKLPQLAYWRSRRLAHI